MLIHKDLSTAIKEIEPLSERILRIRINSKPKALTVIQVYAPTSESSEECVEDFYAKLKDTLRRADKEDVTLITGDFNTKIERGEQGFSIGQFGSGIREERGDRLEEFAEQNRLIVCNTQFEHHERRLYT